MRVSSSSEVLAVAAEEGEDALAQPGFGEHALRGVRPVEQAHGNVAGRLHGIGGGLAKQRFQPNHVAGQQDAQKLAPSIGQQAEAERPAGEQGEKGSRLLAGTQQHGIALGAMMAELEVLDGAELIVAEMLEVWQMPQVAILTGNRRHQRRRITHGEPFPFWTVVQTRLRRRRVRGCPGWGHWSSRFTQHRLIDDALTFA